MENTWHEMSHNIPKTTLESLNEVVAGYNKTADVGDLVDDEEISEVRDVGEDNAGRQRKFLAEIGVLRRDGYDYYLTEKGNELGHLIRFNEQEDAGKIYRELLDDWEPADEILAHLDDEGLDLEDLVDKVALVTANELSSRRNELGAETIVDLFEWAGYLEEEDGIYRVAEESKVEEREEETLGISSDSPVESEQVEAQTGPPASANGGVAKRQQSIQTGGLNISLDISGSDDPENVRQLLLAIRQGTQENVDNYENPEEDE
jgi:hypothetical protein